MSPRCPRCAVQVERCFCSHLTPLIENQTPIVILRHAKERARPTNTAAIAQLALAQCRLVDYGERDLEPLDIDLLVPDGAQLLYPDGDGARLVEDDAPLPSALIVLDGTWSQTQRLVRRHARLSSLPRFALAGAERPDAAPRLRHSDDPDRLLTIEALASYLAIAESEELGSRLRRVHRRFVAATLAARGERVPLGWIDAS